MPAQIRTIPAGTVLWRIHGTQGNHVIPWNRLRTYGPLSSARWDPHPEPEGDHAPTGAAYLGFDQITCLAEVFQSGRFVDVDTHAPYITGMVTDADLKLIDIVGLWFTRVGGTAALAAGDKRMTRKWAKAMHAAYPEADGMISPSAVVTGKEVLTLWVDKMPEAPAFTSALNSPAITGDIARLADEIGFTSNIG